MVIQQKSPELLITTPGTATLRRLARMQTAFIILANRRSVERRSAVNLMSKEKRDTILRLLVEGNSIRSVCRLMGTNIPSVLRQLLWAGARAKALMERRFKSLDLTHIEADEVWTS